MRVLISLLWLATFFCLTIRAGMCEQAATSPQSVQQTAPSPAAQQDSQNQATLQAFQKEQKALGQKWRSLVAGGATQQQLKVWHQQNSALFALQEKRAEVLAMAAAMVLRPTNRKANIPADASPALKDILTTQTALANARAQIHNQLMQGATASGSSLTFAKVGQVGQQGSQLFEQQNAALISLQKPRLQLLANASSQMVRAVPESPAIPPNATPQLAAFLTTRNQLRRELVQMRNQYANASPAIREAAMQEWHKKNASQFAQLQQQAQSLSQASTTISN